MKTHQAKLEIECRNILGEGPVWNYLTQELIWVDIKGKSLHSYHPQSGKRKDIPVGQLIGTVVPTRKGHWVAALESGIYEVRENGYKRKIADPEPDKAYNRFNDGKCDPAGRLWVGSMELEEVFPTGAMYSVDATGEVRRHFAGVFISNGLVWTKDEKTFYFIDSPTLQVKAFDYNKAEGSLSNGRIIANFGPSMGYPDGMAIDEHDNLWIAFWAGKGVGCWDTKESVFTHWVEVPALNVTACAFGGPNLDTLYITTASDRSDGAEYPQAGNVFVAQPGVKGQKCFFFGDV